MNKAFALSIINIADHLHTTNRQHHLHIHPDLMNKDHYAELVNIAPSLTFDIPVSELHSVLLFTLMTFSLVNLSWECCDCSSSTIKPEWAGCSRTGAASPPAPWWCQRWRSCRRFLAMGTVGVIWCTPRSYYAAEETRHTSWRRHPERGDTK